MWRRIASYEGTLSLLSIRKYVLKVKASSITSAKSRLAIKHIADTTPSNAAKFPKHLSYVTQ